MLKLLWLAWSTTLLTMFSYGACSMTTLLWLGQHPPRAAAERAATALIAVLVLIVVASIWWFAQRATLTGNPARVVWIVIFALWQLALAAVGAFITLVALNQ